MRAELARLAASGGILALVLTASAPLVPLIDDEPGLSSSPAAPIVMALPPIAGDVWQSRGRLVHQEQFDASLEGNGPAFGEGWRAVYTSVSGVDGRRRDVSGAFFVPRGVPPVDGWPVVSLAHGTTGIGNNCGPAQEQHLLGYQPIVESLLVRGFAVALSDFEGLGMEGSHPYLEPRSAAFNIIDAVRALQSISPNVSTRWVAAGYSQGGQAVWAANELNSFYGSGLQLQGSVAIAPAANVTGVVDLIWSRSLTDEQAAFLPMLTTGLLRYDPDLDEHAFLPAVPDPEWLTCRASDGSPVNSGPLPTRAFAGRESRPEGRHDSAALREGLRVTLRRVALPQRPLGQPMLVITGERDPLILPVWVESAVAQSCVLGGRIEYLEVPDADHRDILWKRSDVVMRWIAERFAGQSAPSNCPAGD